MRFQFTGTVHVNDETTKNPSIRDGKTKSGIEYKSLGLGISNQKNNSAWVELFGMNNSVIKTKNADNENIEISADDRFDADIISEVASYRKNVINLGDERREFISSYDTVATIEKNLSDINGKKFTITGQTNANVYNGKVSHRFTIQNIYAANEEAKNQLKVSDTFYFTKDSFDTADWKDEHKLTINGWINTYFDKTALGKDQGKNMYTPLQVVFDCSKIDWDNEKHVKLVNYKLKQIGCELADGKIKCNLKKNVYKIAAVLAFVNGAQEEEFDESMLSDNQKEAIELGIKSIDDFKPSGGVYGSRVTMYKLVDFDLRGDYEDGYIDTEMKFDELEEELFIPDVTEESLEEVEKAAEESSDDEDDDDDDIFS